MKTSLYVTLIGLLLLAGVTSTLAQPASPAPVEAQQVLFIVDNSQSMTEKGFDPATPGASRWEILKRVFPQWQERLDQDVLVGAVSIGGACGSAPTLKLPVGTERAAVAGALNSIAPDGQTNLNRTLQAAPGLFPKGVQGGKRIMLLSDGLNTCAPNESTCEIVRELHKDHGIVVDVIAWITDPRMVDEFKCVAQVSNGTFTAPATINDWITCPLPGFDLWRYVVLVLGLLTLLMASQIFYRNGHHVFGWSTRPAVLSAGLFLGLGTLALYLVLFVGAGLGAAILGALVLTGTLAMMVSNKNATRSIPRNSSAARWTLLSFLLLIWLLFPITSRASEPPSNMSRKAVQGAPNFHHILVLDVSGSVAAELTKMKELLARYAEKYVRPDEEVSLIVFGYDDKGSVKEICTFRVAESGSTTILSRSLDDLVIQNPKKTRTYFKPLADYLTQFLHQVRLQPVVLVVSDGRSDALEGPDRGKADFREIPFESLGTRGVYRMPGVDNWKVAIQGGAGLDLTTLFQKPVTDIKPRQGAPLTRPIDPCLIEPALLVTTGDRITLIPDLNPLSDRLQGSLPIHVRNECVSRFRSFKVEITQGERSLTVGKIEHTLVDENPRSFTFPISVSSSGLKPGEAVVQITLDQGGTARTIYPVKPSVVTVESVTYWSRFGIFWLIAVISSTAFAGILGLRIRRHLKAKRNAPEMVTILGGNALALRANTVVTLGGEGCSLVVPGVPPQVALASMEWTGTRGELRLRPDNRFRMRINGTDALAGSLYQLGQPLQFIHPESEVIYDVPIHSAGKGCRVVSSLPGVNGDPLGGSWMASNILDSTAFAWKGDFGSASPGNGNGGNGPLI